MVYRSPEVLLRWFLDSSDKKMCLSFPRFAGEGTHPFPTPLGHQGGPLVQPFLLFPPQTFGPDKTLMYVRILYDVLFNARYGFIYLPSRNADTA